MEKRIISGINEYTDKGKYKGNGVLQKELKNKFIGAKIVDIKFGGWFWFDIEEIKFEKDGNQYVLKNREWPSIMLAISKEDTL